MRIVYSLLTNCSEMFVLGSFWVTWHFTFREQTCSSGNEMDNSIWQTFGTFDLLHSSHMRIPTILFRGKHSTTMQIRIVSRLWFCWRLWKLKIDFWRNIVRFWKKYICSNILDVQETNSCFSQFNKIRNHFSRCRFTLSLSGFGNWSVSFRNEQNRWAQERAIVKPYGSWQAKHA